MSLELKYKLTEKIHSDVVLGKNQSLPRSIAIKMLSLSNVPRSADILYKVLESNSEVPKFRRLAAIELWRANTAEAHDYLMKAVATVKDQTTLISVVKCLGRVGDQRALQAILSIKENAQGLLAAQATFAASLISYRLGLKGNDLPVPSQYVNIPSTARRHRLSFVVPSQAEADIFTDCMAHEPYGIELSPNLQQFVCPGGAWVVGFNREIAKAKAIEILRSRKTLMGIVAAKHSEDGRYSASFLIFTAPNANEAHVDITVTRITGEVAWTGVMTSISADQANLVIRTVGRIGIVPMELEGTINSKGEIKITNALTGDRVSDKRRPLRLDIAAI